MHSYRYSILLVLMFVVVIIFVEKHSKSSQPPRTEESPTYCAIIHEPPAGCPSGYTKESSPRFTESDGSKQFACIFEHSGKEECTDMLKPGESEEMTIPLPVVRLPMAPKKKI